MTAEDVRAQRLREIPSVLETYQGLPGAYQEQWQRFADPVITGYAQRSADALKELERLGETQRADLNRAFDRRSANIRSELTSRGLGTSTALQNALRGNEAQRQAERRRLEDQLTRERLSYQTGLSGDQLQAMQSLGVGGFTQAFAQPTEMFARAKERLVGQGISGIAAQDAATIQAMQAMGMMPINLDQALAGAMVNLGAGAQYAGGVSPWTTAPQPWVPYTLPQPEYEGPGFWEQAGLAAIPGLIGLAG